MVAILRYAAWPRRIEEARSVRQSIINSLMGDESQKIYQTTGRPTVLDGGDYSFQLSARWNKEEAQCQAM